MSRTLKTLVGTGLVFVALVATGIRQYDWNVSALLHMDTPFGERHHVPAGVVLYKDAAYDGMLYYQVARDLPALVSGQATSLDSPYRFQRILLPLLTFIVTLGHEHWFPLAMLLINVLSSLGALWLILKMTKGKTIHSLAVVFNPAILVGILYMLTEPLSTFFIVLFLYLWKKDHEKIGLAALLAIILSLFARETTVFLIALLLAWSVWKKQWRNAVLLLAPVPLFLLWQYYLDLQFGAVGFQANSNIITVPLSGPVQLFKWLFDGRFVSYRLSTLGLIFFIVPLCGGVGKELLQKKWKIDVLGFLLGGLTATLLCMHPHMWGAITSIGRVVTPIYPVYALWAADRDTRFTRGLSLFLCGMSLVAALGIAWVAHPYSVS